MVRKYYHMLKSKRVNNRYFTNSRKYNLQFAHNVYGFHSRLYFAQKIILQVVDKYKRLLKLIAKCNLPASFISPPTYNRLMYESYYHLAVALQNLGRHKEAVHAYTNAILSMNLRKVRILCYFHIFVELTSIG